MQSAENNHYYKSDKTYYLGISFTIESAGNWQKCGNPKGLVIELQVILMVDKAAHHAKKWSENAVNRCIPFFGIASYFGVTECLRSRYLVLKVHAMRTPHIKRFLPPETTGDKVQHGECQRANFKLCDCQVFDVAGDVLDEKPGDL